MVNRGSATAALSVLVLLGAIGVVLGPNLPYLASHLLGAVDGDGANHMWGWQWVQTSLLEQGRIPLEMDLSNHPDGGAFFCLDTADALLFLPLAVLPPTLGHNLVSLTHLALAAVSAWWLARHWVDDESALAAGLCFALSPFVLTHGLATGVAEGLFLFGIPLVMGLAFRTWTRPGWAAPVLLGLVTGVQALGSWHYGLIAGLLTLMGGALYARKPAPGLHLRLPVAMVVAAVALLPLFALVGGTVGEGAAYERGLSVFPAMSAFDLPPVNIFGLADAVVPGKQALRVFAEGPDRMVATGYLGFAALALAAWGRSWKLGVLAALFFGFALGPRIHIWALDGQGLPNPLYLAFYSVAPLFHETRHVTSRFIVGTSLALGLAAALGASRLPRWPRRVALGALVLEVVALSPAPWPLPHTPTAAHTATAAISGPVLDIPWLTPAGHFDDDILVQAMVHRQPIPFNLQGGGDQLLSPSVRQNPFVNGLRHQLEDGRPGHCGGTDELRAMGFEQVLMRRDEQGLQETLTRCLGAGEVFEDRVLYSL
jgi:hypothetical protein